MAEQILPWLNSHLDLRRAYEFPRDQIIACLKDIVDRPARYGVPGHYRPMLLQMNIDIVRLHHPSGGDCVAPAPPQNVDREDDPRWPAARTAFRLVKFEHDGLNYWALSDLLVLFMSKLGRAPIGATKRNFYLPLTAVFEQWCSKLLVEENPPGVYQCGWTPVGVFHLGASKGGFVADKENIGSWSAVIDRARFGIVQSEGLRLANWSQTWTPTIRSKGEKRGKPYGRCAESYPFRKLLIDSPEEGRERVCGLALCRSYISRAPTYDDRLSGDIWDNLWDPCPDCEALINLHHGKVENFDKLAGSEGAPP